MARMPRVLLPLVIGLVLAAVPAGPAGASGSWPWPVRGPVIRGFDPPDTPYGSGHRGIDIAVAFGTPILAPAPGLVSFAGKVGGHLFVSIDHGGGIVSTYSWLSALSVRKGARVSAGTQVALTGYGHPGSLVPHLHFGVKRNGEYADPLSFLAAPNLSDVIRLAPIPPPGAA